MQQKKDIFSIFLVAKEGRFSNTDFRFFAGSKKKENLRFEGDLMKVFILDASSGKAAIF